MNGPDLDPRLDASMRRMILQHARTSGAKSRSIRRTVAAIGTTALLAGIAAAAVAVIATGVPLSGSTPPAASTQTPTPSPTRTATPSPAPTPVEPTSPPQPPASETPIETTDPVTPEPEIDRVNGYAAQAAWDACLAAGLDTYGAVYTPSSSYSSSSVSEPTAAGQEGVVVTIGATVEYLGQPIDTAWFCGVAGDVDSPTVIWTDVRDK